VKGPWGAGIDMHLIPYPYKEYTKKIKNSLESK
jgi:hypothetical protein